MIKVKIQYEAHDPDTVVTVEGYAPAAPRIGKQFSYYLPTFSSNETISLGKVYNIERFDDVLLVQTELVVAEVWIENEGSPMDTNLIQFRKPLATTYKIEPRSL